MNPTIIGFIIFGFLLSFGWMYMANRKRKKVGEKFNVENQRENTPQILKKQIEGNLSFLSTQLGDVPIDAFTQAKIPVSRGRVAKNMAVDAAKTAAWALVGVRARYTREDALCYFILSGDDLHFLSYFQAELGDHIIIGRDRLEGATIEQETKKLAHGRQDIANIKEYRLVVDVDGEILQINFYNTVIDGRENMNFFGEDYHKESVELNLMGEYFIEQLEAKYSNLKIKN